MNNTNTLFENYFQDINYDEMLSPSMEIHPQWEKLFSNITKIGFKGLDSRQNDLNWHLTENGVTYNVYNDPQGLNRPWNLNVIPSLIHEKEWQVIEKGIKQRTEILNFILKDIYGDRELIKKGIIPQEVIFSHRGFLRPCDAIDYNTSKNLLIHSADLARGPDGRMWVINDRTQAPSGMGYALENRSTMGRVLPDLFDKMHVRRLSGFFKHLNELLLSSSPTRKENPNIVVMTPGPHNETYFEHAYLASFLGYSLVQGNDLIIRNGFLWMKSLKGLKKIDVVLRRVDDVFTDPLELREDSHLGVAGLLDVVRRKNVTIINQIGSRVLENPGLIPFIPSVAKYYLNEELLLPQIATWWCGQKTEKEYVFKNLEKLIVKTIDRSTKSNIYFCDQLNNQELEELKIKISNRPYRFVAQEKIGFSTTPTFHNGQLEPRNSVWRTFSVAHKDTYSVMPGGLIRVAGERGNINVSNQKGGTSKDMWIIDDEAHPKEETTFISRKSMASASGMDNLPSQTAENLYWAGRYVGRTLSTARFLRTVLKQLSYIQFQDESPNSSVLHNLYNSVTHLTQTYPGFIGDEETPRASNPFNEIFSVILDTNKAGSLSNTLSLFKNTYYAIRNLWSSDMWRVFERIDSIWNEMQQNQNHSIRSLIKALDQIITRLIAFMGLIEESILIDQGLLLYFIGLQTEQSMLTISKCRSLLIDVKSDQVEYEILESLLNSHESLNIYRYTYRSFITPENVIDLMVLDQKYPRSLAYMLNRLNKDLAELPHSKTSHELTEYQKYVFEAHSLLKLSSVSDLAKIEPGMGRNDLSELLSKLYDLLSKSSVCITDAYFSHTQKQNQLVKLNLPI